MESVSGLRVKNPVVSSIVLRERLADYAVLRIPQVCGGLSESLFAILLLLYAGYLRHGQRRA